MTTSTTPIPVAVRLDDGLVLRGHEWDANGPAVVLLHDAGDDLDAWSTVPRSVASKGFRTIGLELPGHGLSDGEFDAGAWTGQLKAMVKEITAWFGPIALVGYGSVAEAMLDIGERDGVPVQVLVSPSPYGAGIDHAASPPAMRLILSGTGAETAHAYVESIYPRVRGQRMLVTGASTAVGPALLVDQPSLLEHLVMFLRKYLIGVHLEWIADHADQINEAAERLRGAAADET